MKPRAWILVVGSCVVLLCLAVGSAPLSAKQQKVLVGMPKFFPPQYSLDADGKPTGFAVEMLNTIADQANLSLEYKVYPDWKSTFQALENRKIDVIPNLGISEKRRDHFSYTKPVETFGIYLFLRSAETEINSLNDLNNKIVVTVEGNISVDLLRQESQIKLKIEDDVEDALFALLSGDADAMVYPEPWTQQMAYRVGIEDRIKKVGQPLLEVKRAMAVHKDNITLLRIFNNELDNFIGSKSYQSLYVKWFGKPKKYWTIKRVVIIFSISIALIMLVFIFFHYRSVLKINRALRQSEQALSISEERLALALDGSNDGIWDWNVRTNAVFYSPRWYEILGYKEQDLYPIYESWADLLHPDEREYLTIQVEALLDGTNTELYAEHRLKNKEGEWVWVLGRGKVVSRDSLGKPVRAVGTMMDIGARKHAENLLASSEYEHREIIDNMIDGVVTIDETGSVLSFNTAAEEIFGYRREEIISRNIKELMPENESHHHDDYLSKYIQTGDEGIIGSVRDVIARHQNGKEFPLRLSLSEIPKDSRGKRRFIGACFDITEQKEQEMLLRRSQKMDALGNLTSGIAHDYNNMLNVIIGYAGILQKKLKDTPDLTSFAVEIESAGLRGAELTKKLLSFSSTRPGKAKRTDINAVLSDNYNLLAKTLTVQVELKQQLDSDLWVVKLDKGDLEDAVINMSINAMHAMPQGGILKMQTSNVHLEQEEARSISVSAGDFVKLTLVDSGVGMDELTASRVFEPFFSTKGEHGTGLGLSQVYGFVKRSNGSITLVSRVGEGTTISLYFPREKSDSESSQDKLEKEKEILVKGHESVLVVDDEAGIRRLTKDFLGNEGYNVYLAESTDHALEVLSREHIDIVFTDVLMPGKDGYELALLVKRQYPDIKVLLASGYTGEHSTKDIDKDLQANMLRKPCTPEQVLLRLRSILDANA